MVNIRKATIEDLPFLYSLDSLAFEPGKRFSQRSIRNSVLSYTQKVFILEEEGIPCASATLLIHPNAIRIYSIAVLPDKQNMRYGRTLMEYIIEWAKEKYVSKITLEADMRNPKLVEWYQSFGFETIGELPGYYGENSSAYRMQRILLDSSHKIKNIVVVDKPQDFLDDISNVEIVDAKDYINLEKYQKLKDARVFNLCSSYEYQSMGYYVSLLASARRHRIIPNVATIKDFTDSVITESIADDFWEQLQKTLSKVKEDRFELEVYFGKCDNKKYQSLAKALYKLFESPLIRFVFKKEGDWSLKEAIPLTTQEVDLPPERLRELAANYFSQKKFAISRFKNYKYSLAILTDPTELTPPSCKRAIRNFMSAAEKLGFYVELITKEDYARLTEFDALFIRATTNVNNFTYLFSRYAYAEGLAVIDDPWSILKCANKIYLAETMKQLGVKTPNTAILCKGLDYKKQMAEFAFPLVLKEPDNAFGLGVFKADNMPQLEKIVEKLFDKSEIVLAQEFVKSDFDWRIGILDRKPLYACKYYMVEKHWQIEKWGKGRNGVVYGKYETIPIEQAPKEVVKVALRAANAMGDGLYGVDLKEKGGSVYVIEVNDNPSIDYGVEDKVLKSKLYSAVMRSLYNRLESGAGEDRLVSQEYKRAEK
jgi:glutathione synthase/RimK-type ligase-like ATP-grasp enzyme/ribosomal protein S18 acetylase RimI-like enzyme